MSRPKSLATIIIPLILLPFIILATKKIIDIRKNAAGFPANIIINTAVTQGSVPSRLWQNLAQGGEEAKDMIAPVIPLVKALQPQLIRIDHIIDYYQIDAGNGQYNFSRLDDAINSILATGAVPMLSISYTPDAKEPSDWSQWFRLISALARHYSVDRQIDGIYYEVWNEPDLFGQWHYARSPNYSTLYLQTAKALLSGAPAHNYKIGGPATTGYYSNWIKSLFKTASSNGIPLDFISWHKYSKYPEDYQTDIENLGQILTQYPQFFSIEKIITETGPDSEPNSWYDNSLSGIHLLSLTTKLAGQIHRLFSFEIVDGPISRSELSSGWGLITHPSKGGQTKPRYQAIRFLNQLNGLRLASVGDGSWVSSLSSINDRIIQTLLVNYDPNNSHVETVPITFQNLTNGNYRLQIGHYLGVTTSKNISVVNNTYTDNFYLEPNSAILLQLIPGP